VHHLWRQFKAFGNKADAAAGDSANGGAPGGGRGGACFGEAAGCRQQLGSNVGGHASAACVSLIPTSLAGCTLQSLLQHHQLPQLKCSWRVYDVVASRRGFNSAAECGQMGHMARDCPNKGAKGQKGAGDGAAANGSVLALKVLPRRVAQRCCSAGCHAVLFGCWLCGRGSAPVGVAKAAPLACSSSRLLCTAAAWDGHHAAQHSGLRARPAAIAVPAMPWLLTGANRRLPGKLGTQNTC
jgi:Zinc knuckle